MFSMTNSRELDEEQRQDGDVNKRYNGEDVKFYPFFFTPHWQLPSVLKLWPWTQEYTCTPHYPVPQAPFHQLIHRGQLAGSTDVKIYYQSTLLALTRRRCCRASHPPPRPWTPTCQGCSAPPRGGGAGGGFPGGAYTAAHPARGCEGREARSCEVILTTPLLFAGRSTAAPDPGVCCAGARTPPSVACPRGMSRLTQGTRDKTIQQKGRLVSSVQEQGNIFL